jgi:hypothetical protein
MFSVFRVEHISTHVHHEEYVWNFLYIIQSSQLYTIILTHLSQKKIYICSSMIFHVHRVCLLPWTNVLQHPVFSSRPIHTQAMTRKLLRPPTSCIYNTLCKLVTEIWWFGHFHRHHELDMYYSLVYNLFLHSISLFNL